MYMKNNGKFGIEMYNIVMSKLFSILPSSLRIGVLRGGPSSAGALSSEYDSSIKSGAHVLRQLSETHNPVDIFISKDGTWHMQGVPRTPERILKSLDVVLSTLHGAYGEDGQVQQILSNHGIKYVGSDRYTSAVAMNRQLAKDHLIPFGIKTPVHIVVRNSDSVYDRAQEIFNSIPHPLAVKPAVGGSAYGFAVVENFPDLVGVLEALLSRFDSVVVEEFIKGISVSCLVTEDFRDQGLYAFPPATPLLVEETHAVEDMAKKVHELLGLSHYSQSDFIVSPRRGVYFLEVNTSPKLAEKSLAMKALEEVGVSQREFLHHIIALALNDKVR